MSTPNSDQVPIISTSTQPDNPPPQKASQAENQKKSPSEESRTSRLLKKLGNPFPKSLGKSCLHAANVLENYLEQTQEQSLIPQNVFDTCSGLAIITVLRGAYGWSGRLGSGLVVARNSDGSWSCPWAIQVFGVGYGLQVGIEISDMVVVLRDKDSLNALMQKGNVSLGGNLTLALGPYGRNVELDVPVTCALMYSISKSQGLFAGVSLEVSLFLQAGKNTSKFYGQKVSIDDILQGRVNVPEEAKILHKALNDRFPPPYSPSTLATSSSPTDESPSTSNVPHLKPQEENTSEKAGLLSRE